jgi:hypothetical protein
MGLKITGLRALRPGTGPHWLRPAMMVAVPALVAGPLLTGQCQAAALPDGLDPATARCVLQHIDDVRGDEAVTLLVRACRSLIDQGDGGGADATGAAFLVRCVVRGDPAWIEHRLVTREQCAQAQGTTRER